MRFAQVMPPARCMPALKIIMDLTSIDERGRHRNTEKHCVRWQLLSYCTSRAGCFYSGGIEYPNKYSTLE